jgi:sulfane dehydrogenase subunit SoxC
LQDLTGNITPSDLHFERHHAGIPALDPERHTLTIHGLVGRPLTFSLDDIKRFPQVDAPHFMECAGNGRAAYRDPKPDLTPQKCLRHAEHLRVDGRSARDALPRVPV